MSQNRAFGQSLPVAQHGGGFRIAAKCACNVAHMSIVIDGIAFAQQDRGGVSRVWEEYLTRLGKSELDITFLAPRFNRSESLRRVMQDPGNLKLRDDYLHFSSRYLLGGPRAEAGLLRAIHLKKDDNVFHSTWLSTVHRPDVVKIVTVHDVIPEILWKSHRTVPDLAYVSTRKYVYNNADHLIAVSNSTREAIERIYPDISMDNVTVIPNGVSTLCSGDQPDLADVNRRIESNLESGGFLLHVGQRHGYKNFDIVIDLFREKAAYRDTIVVCVGGGDPSKLKEQIRQAGLEKNFVFLGAVDDCTLAALYRNARALIYPSLYEGFGLPVLEAMVNDCPVVCSSIPPLREVGGDAAIFFEPESVGSLNDAIRSLDTVSLDHLRQRGVANAARYSWDSSAEQLLALYRQLS